MPEVSKSARDDEFKYSVVLTDENSNEVVWKNYHLTEWFLVIKVSMLILLAGLHYVWAAPILPSLLDGSEKIHITMEESVLVFGIMNAGVIPGTISGSQLADRFGRRRTCILTAALFSLAGLILVFASTVNILYFSRLLSGFCTGVSESLAIVYCSEIAPPDIRGTMILAATIHLNLGMVVAYVIGTGFSYQMNTIICCVIPLVILVGLISIPESPPYLIYKNDFTGAEQSLKYLRRRSNVEDELKSLSEGHTAKSSQTNNCFDLFTVKTNRWALFVICGLTATTELCGSNVFSQYSTVIFERADATTISPDTASLLQSIVNFLVVLASGFFIEKIGRRILLLASCLLTVIPLMATGLYFYAQEHGYPGIHNYSLVPFIGLTSLKLTVAIGIYSLPFVYIGELFPTNVKATASAIGFITIAITNFLITKLFQILTDNFTYDLVFYTFAGFCAWSAIFFYMFVPETCGKSLEEIQNDLKKRVK